MYLLESRLAPLARKEGLPSIDDLIHVIRARREERLIGQLVDVMTTNETFFFRDKTPFDHLKNAILPVLGQARKGNRIRIWCAASSTGQEPYSIAMMLDQNPALTAGVPVEIIATDISDRCLDRARQGLFTQFEVQRGLPIRKLIAYFEKAGDLWRISDRLRAGVRFEAHNLLKHPGQLGQFDIIMLAHVISSFDTETRIAVLSRAADALHPGGAIILGAGETLPEGCEGLTIENGIVRKAGAWFTYEADQLGQGKENARKYLKKNPEVADEIERRILTHLGIGVPGEVPPGIDPVTGEVNVVMVDGEPKVKGGKKCEDLSACVQLRNYKAVIDFTRQAASTFGFPDPSPIGVDF